MPRPYDEYLRERRARIAGWLAQRTEADIVTGICERWVRDLADNGRVLHSRHDLPALSTELSLVTRLFEANLGALSDALAWKIDGGEGVEPAEAALIGHALALACGRAYAVYGPCKLSWIGHLVSTIDSQAWEVFADSAAAALREDADRWSEFVEFLTAIIEEANDEPDRVTEIPPRRASMASIVEQFARSGSFQEVWEADLWPVFFRWSDVFEIMRRAEPERFLQMIDELPHPTLVRQCLSSKALTENRSDVLELLRLAGASFDAEGRWQRRGMAAILLLQLASVQLLSAANAPDGQGRHSGCAEQQAGLAGYQVAKKVEDLTKGVTLFSEAADDLLDIVFARSDGVELGWHWLENLLRQIPQRLPPADGCGQRKFMINHIGILVHAVSCRLAPLRAQDEWIAQAEPLVRQYRAVAVLSVAAFSSAATNVNIGAVARGLLKRNGFELTRASELIQLPGAPLRTIAGDALARIPNTASWFTDSWKALRFEREQAWHRRPTRGGIQANPAEIMGLWGLGAIESLVMNAGLQRDDACAMWLAIELAFREARLVEPRTAKDFWSQAVARLFAWWPSLFASMQEPAASSEVTTPVDPAVLGRVLAPYIGISGDFMAVVVSLHQAGVRATQLDRAVHAAGQDLVRMIRRFLETARGLKDRRLWNQEWVAELGRIEVAIAARRPTDWRRDIAAAVTPEAAEGGAPSG